jgi:hypothetical protein
MTDRARLETLAAVVSLATLASACGGSKAAYEQFARANSTFTRGMSEKDALAAGGAPTRVETGERMSDDCRHAGGVKEIVYEYHAPIAWGLLGSSTIGSHGLCVSAAGEVINIRQIIF